MFLQTWLAFRGREPLDERSLHESLRRVEHCVNGCRGEGVERLGQSNGRIGHFLWTLPDQARALGLVSDTDGATSRFDLHLTDAPDGWPDPHRHPFPWLRSRFDADGLEVRIDPLGFARLYRMRMGDRDVWSNRMSALAAFVGRVPRSSLEGWSCYASIGWFLEGLLPFEDMSILSGGTVIRCSLDGEGGESTGVDLDDLLFGHPVPDDAAVLDALTTSFVSRTRAQPGPVESGLSGGRDSRLVAAVAIAAGVADAVEFHTAVPPELEVEVADRLLRASPVPLRWRLEERASKDWDAGVDPRRATGRGPRGWLRGLRLRRGQGPASVPSRFARRVLDWHAIFDADTYPTFVYRDAPESCLTPVEKLAVTGAAGEFAHANFYTGAHLGVPPRQRVAAVRTAFFDKARFVSPAAREVGGACFDSVVAAGAGRGLRDLRLLDYYYVRGRFRRWAGGNWGAETYLPLANPVLLQAGFWQTPEDKLASGLHRRLTSRLVPQWADVPYLGDLTAGLPVRARTNVGARRYLWESGQYGEFTQLLEDTENYGDVFDADAVRRCFRDVGSAPPDDMVRLQNVAFRVVWREGFERYRADLERRMAAHDRRVARSRSPLT